MRIDGVCVRTSICELRHVCRQFRRLCNCKPGLDVRSMLIRSENANMYTPASKAEQSKPLLAPAGDSGQGRLFSFLSHTGFVQILGFFLIVAVAEMIIMMQHKITGKQKSSRGGQTATDIMTPEVHVGAIYLTRELGVHS